MKCFDCHSELNPIDAVHDSRCVGGDSHCLYPSFVYGVVPVHADRRLCIVKKQKAEAEWEKSQDAQEIARLEDRIAQDSRRLAALKAKRSTPEEK